MLWDALPAGLFLGGAPFNVACHLRSAGVPAAIVSRIGADRLGEEMLRRAALSGVATDLVQTDHTRPTGFVRVSLDACGVAEYDIVAPAAWDALALDDALVRRAGCARAIVFGSLGQRHATARATIAQLWRSGPTMVFDVNLRPPFDDAAVVERSLRHADLVKVNEDELRRLAHWFDLPGDMRDATAALAEHFSCDTVCVTRGRHGAALWHGLEWSEHPGFDAEVRDTVGAGDAFLAVLLAGLFAGETPSRVLEHANRIGAYVCTHAGAGPTHQSAAIAQRM